MGSPPQERRSGRGRVLAAVAAGALVAAGLAVAWVWWGGAGQARPYPPPVRLVVAEQFEYRPEKPLGAGEERHFLGGRDGDFWVFHQGLVAPLTAVRITAKGAGRPEAVSPADCDTTDAAFAANDASGSPVLVMIGCVRNSIGSSVAARTWTGEQWSEPAVLGSFQRCGSLGKLAGCVDSAGRIHVVYQAPLTPRESYARGIVVASGEFPVKCHHAYGDGRTWSSARPTTGPGRFYLFLRSLEEMADGKLCLRMEVHEFGLVNNGPTYEGIQLWDGKRWSKKQRASSAEPPALISVCDWWGNRLFWQEGPGGVQGLLARGGSAWAAERVPLLSRPALHRDRQGRLVMASADGSRGELRLWSGSAWAGSVTFPFKIQTQRLRLLSGPGGSIYLVGETDSLILAQRVSIEPGPAAP